jgi:hypothetical protein
MALLKFKQIRRIDPDILVRAKVYRKHEDSCQQCKRSRYTLRVVRCPEGQQLWNEVGL